MGRTLLTVEPVGSSGGNFLDLNPPTGEFDSVKWRVVSAIQNFNGLLR
jgi:hypothetical protein